LGEHIDCEQIESSTANPTKRAEKQELADALAEAIGHIGNEEAEVFCMRYLSEMSYGQISRELGISLSKTGVLLHRAKKKLRVIMGNSSAVDDNSG
jgi:RNA polymerase sigma factor (sigma-70 family)